MKVCQLCAVDFTLKFFLLPLIDGMTKEGWQVEAVCSDGPYIKNLVQEGYKIKNIDIPRNLNLILIFSAIYKLYRLFKKEKYDIVHVHTPLASIIARIAAKLSGVKLIIYTAHGFYFHENMKPLKFYFFVILEKIFGFITDILFTQSFEDQQFAIKFNFLSKKKIFNIGNGVDINKFNPNNIKKKTLFKSKLMIPKGSFTIGLICRLVKEKGLLEFLNAAEKVSENFPNVYFVIVGERLKSDHNDSVEKQIIKTKTKIGKKILFLGNRNDVPQILSVLDLYCLPSWREGMPRSIIEAMMMGKPVLATNIRGSREQIINQKTGVLVPVNSSISLEKEMINLIQDKKKCYKYGLAGRKRALKYYDEKKIIDLQIEIIKSQIEELRILKRK